MLAYKMKRILGYALMLAAVPAAVFLAPRIGVWFIPFVLGSGALGGWLTLEPKGERTFGLPEDHDNENAALPQNRDDENPVVLSIYEDPNYSTISGNIYYTRWIHERHD